MTTTESTRPTIPIPWGQGPPLDLDFPPEWEVVDAFRPDLSGPLADYGVSGVEDARLSGGLAGVVGVLVTLLLAGGLARAVRRRTGAAPEA